MNKADVGKVLAVAMAIDARLGAADESETMDFEFARDAVGKHYKSATETLMPAHLNAMWTAHKSRQHEIDNMRAIGTSPKSQGMPDDVRAKLVELGLKRP